MYRVWRKERISGGNEMTGCSTVISNSPHLVRCGDWDGGKKVFCKECEGNKDEN